MACGWGIGFNMSPMTMISRVTPSRIAMLVFFETTG
jgi:hypothetical protein